MFWLIFNPVENCLVSIALYVYYCFCFYWYPILIHGSLIGWKVLHQFSYIYQKQSTDSVHSPSNSNIILCGTWKDNSRLYMEKKKDKIAKTITNNKRTAVCFTVPNCKMYYRGTVTKLYGIVVQWNWIKVPDINSHTHGNLIFLNWKKDITFKNGSEQAASACQRMKEIYACNIAQNLALK